MVPVVEKSMTKYLARLYRTPARMPWRRPYRRISEALVKTCSMGLDLEVNPACMVLAGGSEPRRQEDRGGLRFGPNMLDLPKLIPPLLERGRQ